MLAETGAKTGGVCMRCFGTQREDSRTKQAASRAPTSRTKKFALALTKLDLETFSIWARCSDDDDKVRPASARSLKSEVEFVVAANFTFADNSHHFGGAEVILRSGGPTVSAPFLLRTSERINFEDHTSAYTFSKMTPKLAEELRRKFLQNLARLERQIGRPISQVFPLQYELRTIPPTVGELPAPTFRLPTIVENEV